MKINIRQLVVVLFLLWVGQNIASAAVGGAFTWKGGASSHTTDWNNAANWTLSSGTSSSGIPGGSVLDTVTIPSGVTYSPNFTGVTVTIATLTLNNSSSMTVSGGSLTVSGAITDNGTFGMSGGTVAAATFSASTGVGAVVISGGSLSVTGLASLSTSLSVSNGASFTAGSTLVLGGTLSGAGTFSLGSGKISGGGTYFSPASGAVVSFTTFTNAGSGATFPSGVTVTCSGALTGTLTMNGASFTFNRSSATTIPTGSYSNLVLTGSTTYTLPTSTAIAGNMNIGSSAIVTVNENVTIGTLTLGGTGEPAGTYGSSTSSATHKSAYFGGTDVITTSTSSATGLLVTFPGQTFTSGTGNSGTVTTQTAGTSFNITLSAVSGSSGSYTLDKTYSGTQTVSYSGPANAPNLATPTYTTSVTFVNGQATTVATTLVDAQTTTLTPTVTGLTGIASSSITVNGGTPTAAQSTVAASPTSVPADNSTTSTVTVTLKDTYGNPVSGKTVTLAQTSGSGTPSVSAASGTSTSLGVVTFTVKSITPATDVFTATDSSDTVTVTQTASVTFTTAPPVATTMTVPRPAGLTAKISLADLATNWSDVYSYPVTLTGFSLTSTNGASVYSLNLTTNSGVITASSSSFLGYVNAANVNDQISYTISDGHGNTATGLINIVVSTSPLFGQASTVVPGGPTSTVNFAGQPGYTYTIERSTNLVTGTGWVPLETTNAPAAGPFSYVDHFTDLGGTPPGSAYYRLEWIP